MLQDEFFEKLLGFNSFSLNTYIKVYTFLFCFYLLQSILSMLISSYRLPRLSLRRGEDRAESLRPNECEEAPSDSADDTRDEGLDPQFIEDSDSCVLSFKE